MNGGALQLALREWRAMASQPRSWWIMIAVGSLIGLVGPFDTFDNLALAPRIVYWLAIAVVTFSVGYFTVNFIVALGVIAQAGSIASYAFAGLVAGVPVVLSVSAINLAILPGFEQTFGEFAELAAYCMAISALVSVTLVFVAGFIRSDVGAAAATVHPPPILRRLPIEKRGKLVRLAVQDHYVEVVTERGSHLVLMRLADAISETGDVAGLQTHRSHWVAVDAVDGVRRRRHKFSLMLKDRSEVPVSRSNIAALRDAGLLPHAAQRGSSR